MPAATPAFSDSADPSIGMRATTSQRSVTSLDRALPSEPTTSTSGPLARSSWPIVVSAPASRPTPKHEPLVDSAASEPVQLGPAGLYHRDSLARGQRDGLADPLVGIQPGADMQRDHLHRRAQRFEYRVPPGDHLHRAARAAQVADRAALRLRCRQVAVS